MERSNLHQAAWLTWVTLCGSLLLYFLPPIQGKTISFRKMDLLSDLRTTEKKPTPTARTAPADSISSEPTVAKKSASECTPQLICLEDFSGGVNMKWFLQSLSQTKHEPVRIAFFGDSFIEGDLLTMSFRDTLQSLFGGKGVGYVPLASEVSHFRTSIQHDFGNIDTYSIVGQRDDRFPLGFSGHCFKPNEGAYAEYRPARKKPVDFQVMRLFYQTPSARAIDSIVNDTLSIPSTLEGGPNVQKMTVTETSASSIRFDFTHTDSLNLYGASFETPTGIFVDNFSMRGNSGIGFSFVSDRMLTEFNALQQYRLIVLQYGLNVVSLTDSTNFTSYEINMVRIINRLKRLLPETSFLLVGVSDRASNQNGKFLTYPDIPLMRDVQRRIAAKTKITFWDLYEAMGGENSIVKYVDAKPSLAAKDYTHLTYWGGRKIAVKLAHAILFERNRHGKGSTH
ncbi:MAG: hypothetical protein ACKOE6_05275 [Flammeovirgaceae bacterium]